MKSVVITGASTGIGRGAADYLARKGWMVFPGVRKEADVASFAGQDGFVQPLILDVEKPETLTEAATIVDEALKGERLTGLVNNAGVAMMGPLATQDMAEVRKHFEVNVFGAIATTRAFLDLLGAEEGRGGPPGRIVNITSVGGRVASPFLGAYTATKHAMESVTDTFRRELAVYGIDAIAIGPGAVKTPIWNKAEKHNEAKAYAGTVWEKPLQAFERAMLEAGQTGLDVETVSEAIEKALSDDAPKARYAPVPNKLVNWWAPTLLPKRVIDGVFTKRFGLRR